MSFHQREEKTKQGNVGPSSKIKPKETNRLRGRISKKDRRGSILGARRGHISESARKKRKKGNLPSDTKEGGMRGGKSGKTLQPR